MSEKTDEAMWLARIYPTLKATMFGVWFLAGIEIGKVFI